MIIYSVWKTHLSSNMHLYTNHIFSCNSVATIPLSLIACVFSYIAWNTAQISLFSPLIYPCFLSVLLIRIHVGKVRSSSVQQLQSTSHAQLQYGCQPAYASKIIWQDSKKTKGLTSARPVQLKRWLQLLWTSLWGCLSRVNMVQHEPPTKVNWLRL